MQSVWNLMKGVPVSTIYARPTTTCNRRRTSSESSSFWNFLKNQFIIIYINLCCWRWAMGWDDDAGSFQVPTDWPVVMDKAWNVHRVEEANKLSDQIWLIPISKLSDQISLTPISELSDHIWLIPIPKLSDHIWLIPR